MRIFYVANSRIPTQKAHGMQVIKMCESFGKIVTKVELILPTRNNPIFKDVNIYDYYKVDNHFNIRRLKTPDPRFLLKYKFPQGTFIKAQSLLFFYSLLKYFKNIKINSEDIVYTRDYHIIPLLLLFSKNVVWEAHNLPKNKRIYLFFWKRCRRIIVISQGLKNDLKGLNINEEKICVAPDGVDLKLFSSFNANVSSVKKELNISDEKKVIMYTGHLYEWKGVNTLAQAAMYIDSQAVIVFLGGSDNAILNFKSQYKNFKNIIVAGRVDHFQVPRFLKAADVLVLPNSAILKISSHYTSPLKLFEYMAARKPIVASNLPSLREVLNSSNSMLVEPDDPLSLADGINFMIFNPEAAAEMAENAFQNVKKYTWDNRAKKIIDLLST